ncbi:hypothetical protein L7F22_041461 [Adiantum nelumboides]|nr:hypothetical protein [Adiantum nelumboides]
MVEIDAAIQDDWQQFLTGHRDMPLHVGWWASFDLAGRPLIARYGSLIFSVEDFQPAGVHMRIVFQGLVLIPQHLDLHWQRVRIVGSLGKRCTVDLVFPAEEAMLKRLWIWEGCPLSEIVWDPGEWWWPSEQRLDESVSFFEYTAPIGICSITLWMIWKERCSSVLSAQPSSILDTLVQIWMDGNKEEGSSSEDRQPIPTAHEIGESSGQAEKALQVVTAVTMFKQLMENPRFMEFIQSSSIAHQVQGSLACQDLCLGTVNDVVFGMIAAGMSHYLQRQSGSTKKQMAHLRVRACALVNTRKSPGLQELKSMLSGGSQARWGNNMGYVILPVPLLADENPLNYVHKAKSIIDKKKLSLGAAFSYASGKFLISLIGTKVPKRLTYNCTSHTTLAFSNIFGPLEEIQFFGHPVTHIIPTVAGQPQALCVHVQSYMGKVTLVVSSAKDIIPDPERLCQYMVCALEDMKKMLPARKEK